MAYSYSVDEYYFIVTFYRPNTETSIKRFFRYEGDINLEEDVKEFLIELGPIWRAKVEMVPREIFNKLSASYNAPLT